MKLINNISITIQFEPNANLHPHPALPVPIAALDQPPAPRPINASPQSKGRKRATRICSHGADHHEGGAGHGTAAGCQGEHCSG